MACLSSSIPFPEHDAVVLPPSQPPSRLARRPSFPNLRVRTDQDRTSVSPPPSTASSEASHRAHLGPLDLALASSASSTSTTPTGAARRKPAAATPSEPLTPPLTPSSSFSKDGSASGPPTTPPHDGGSPAGARWAKTLFTGVAPGCASPVQTSPVVNATLDLADLLNSTLHLDSSSEAELPSTRFLVLRNVPEDATADALKRVFGVAVDVKGVLTKFQAQGVVVYAFYDIRHAHSAYSWVSAAGPDLRQEFSPRAAEGPVVAELPTADELEKWAGASSYVSETRGEITIAVEGGVMDATSLQRVFSAVGALKAFTRITSQSYTVEYYDIREAQNAVKQFDGRDMFGSRLRLNFVHGSPATDGSSPSPQLAPGFSPNISNGVGGAPAAQGTSRLPIYEDVDHLKAALPTLSSTARPRSKSDAAHLRMAPPVNSTYARPTPTAASPQVPQSYAPAAHHTQSAVHPTHFAHPQHYPDVSSPMSIHPSWTYPPASGMAAFDPATSNLEQIFYIAGMNQAYSDASMNGGHGMGFAQPFPYGTYPHYQHAPQHSHEESTRYAMDYASAYAHPLPSPSYYPPHVHGGYFAAPPPPAGIEQLHIPAVSQGPRPSAPLITAPSSIPPASAATTAVDGPPMSAPTLPGVPERNQLHVARIESGQDTRTTVMIKNIPNKMTAQDLLGFINEVSPRCIDFCYLRMDFSNGCNVGYAFVNFITVEDLVHFTRSRLGVKWNMYSSEKVLQMSYANYQGKEALVEKFKNSCIMDVREEWRPRIFHSHGPEQGLPEPFPEATHYLRRARGAQNRGGLYVHGPQRRGPLHRTARTSEQADGRTPFRRSAGDA